MVTVAHVIPETHSSAPRKKSAGLQTSRRLLLKASIDHPTRPTAPPQGGQRSDPRMGAMLIQLAFKTATG